MKKLHTLYPEAVIYSILNSELRELVDIEKQNGHPSIKGMQAICDQLLEAIK